MEIAEIVKIGRELLKMLSEYDVRLDDWKYLKMYDEFKRMRKNGVKYRYAVSELQSQQSQSGKDNQQIEQRC